MRHWNSQSFNPLKKKRNKRKKRGQIEVHRSTNCNGACSIVQLSGLLWDPIALFYNTPFHCTTDAFRHKIYCKIQCAYIAQRLLWIVQVRMSTFSYQLFLQRFTNHIYFFRSHEILSLLLVCQLLKELYNICIIVQQSHKCICKTVALDRANFIRKLSHKRLFGKQFRIQI